LILLKGPRISDVVLRDIRWLGASVKARKGRKWLESHKIYYVNYDEGVGVRRGELGMKELRRMAGKRRHHFPAW